MPASSTPSRRTFKVRNILLITLVYISATVALLIAGSPQPFGIASAESAADTLQRVTVQEVEYKDQYTVAQHFVGVVEPIHQSVLGFDSAGTINLMEVEEGAQVSAGQILASLDTERLQSRKRELQANRKRLRSDLALATSTLKRLRSAQRVRAVTDQQVDQAQGRRDQADAALDVVDAQLQAVEIELRKSQLRAPFDGIITRRLVDKGSVVSPGIPAFHLQESNELQIRVGIPVTMLSEFVVGNAYTFSEGDRPFSATLNSLLPGVNETRTVYGLFKFAQGDKRQPSLRPQSLVKLAIERPVKGQGFWVPVSSLSEGRRGLWSIWIAHKNNTDKGHFTAARRSAELLYNDGTNAYVKGTVNSGELVILDGAFKLVPGQPFTIVETANNHL